MSGQYSVPKWARLLCMVAVLGAGSFASSAWAEPLPTQVEGIRVLTAAEVNQWSAQLVRVDVRPLYDFLAARLPNSQHIAYREHSARSVSFDAAQDEVAPFLARLRKRVPDSSKPILFYCNGLKCWKSFKASVVAQRAGYQQVYWFRGGLPEWEAAGFPVAAD